MNILFLFFAIQFNLFKKQIRRPLTLKNSTGAEALAKCGASKRQLSAAAAAGHQPNQIPVQTQADQLVALPQREQAWRLHLDEGDAGEGQGDREEDPEGGAAEATGGGADGSAAEILPGTHPGTGYLFTHLKLLNKRVFS